MTVVFLVKKTVRKCSHDAFFVQNKVGNKCSQIIIYENSMLKGFSDSIIFSNFSSTLSQATSFNVLGCKPFHVVMFIIPFD